MEAECWKKKESTESGDRFYRQLSGERRECTWLWAEISQTDSKGT